MSEFDGMEGKLRNRVHQLVPAPCRVSHETISYFLEDFHGEDFEVIHKGSKKSTKTHTAPTACFHQPALKTPTTLQLAIKKVLT